MELGRRGILGGVFDPPHVGHVALAEAALEQLGLRALLVRVVADPGHKRAETPGYVRLELTELAFQGVPRAHVELDPHPRTVDSLESLPQDGDVVFVVGADELAGFDEWKEPARVLELISVAVASRPGVPDEQLRDARARLPSPDRILFFELDPVPVSSSEVRARVARGDSIEGLVPPAVAGAIARLGLYRSPE